MLIELAKERYAQVEGLFAGLEKHLTVTAILKGATAGKVYVDDVEQARLGLAVYKQRVYLAGEAVEAAAQVLRGFFLEALAPAGRAKGYDSYVIHYAPEWEGRLEAALAEIYPARWERTYLECSGLQADWRTVLPAQYEMQAVGAWVAEEQPLQDIETLREELCSERESVAEFLEKSFGKVARQGDRLAGWCLSEYNQDGRCEVGVATVEAYQQQGVGTAVTLAFLEEAFGRGYERIGWHCWKWNEASYRLAKRASFEEVEVYPVMVCFLYEGLAMSARGNQLRMAGDMERAVEAYEQGFRAGGAPAWAYYNAARSLLALGRTGEAQARLAEAEAHGFDDEEALQAVRAALSPADAGESD